MSGKKGKPEDIKVLAALRALYPNMTVTQWAGIFGVSRAAYMTYESGIVKSQEGRQLITVAKVIVGLRRVKDRELVLASLNTAGLSAVYSLTELLFSLETSDLAAILREGVKKCIKEQ